MKQRSHKLKKSLTNEEHMQVLEIIGLSSKPLSSYGIHERWRKEYSQDRNSDNKYIYEIIKELYKPEFLGEPHPERFLRISYKESVNDQISKVEATEKDHWNRAMKNAKITNNPRNWRYHLNSKGLLLYLISVQENKKNSSRVINKIIKNLSQNENNYPKEEFKFLKYFDAFDEGFQEQYKVSILLEIAFELQNQLKKLTPEYLRYYMIRRLYDEVSFWPAFNENVIVKHLLTKEDRENDKRLENYKIKILNDLIVSEQRNLEYMMIDRVRTKKATYS